MPIVFIINWVGLAVAMLWLLALGEWRAAGLGLAAVFLSHSLMGRVMSLISLPFTLIEPFADKRKSLGLFLSLTIASSWTRYFVITLWMIVSFQCCLHERQGVALIPAALLGFIVATAPWHAEPDNAHTMISLVAINTIALTLMIAFAGFHASPRTAFWYSIGAFNVFSLAHYRMLVEAMPELPRGRELRWYESAWAYSFSTILIMFGGYLLGLLGVATGYVNERIFNSKIPKILKFVASGAVSAVCFLISVGVSLAFSLTSRP